MCTRRDAAGDPLLRLFFDTYRLNLLAVPRERADVGDVYVRDGKAVGPPGRLEHLLARPFSLPEAARDEVLAPIAGTLSRSVGWEVGLGLLQGFMAALGASLPLTEVTARLEGSGARRLRFRLEDATRDSVDPGLLGLALVANERSPSHPLLGPSARCYVVAGVARSKSFTVAFESEAGHAVEAGVGLASLVEAKGGATVKQAAASEVTFAGPKRLAFGVELYELAILGPRLRLKLPEAAFAVRGPSAGVRPQPVLIGGEDDDLFLPWTEEV